MGKVHLLCMLSRLSGCWSSLRMGRRSSTVSETRSMYSLKIKNILLKRLFLKNKNKKDIWNKIFREFLRNAKFVRKLFFPTDFSLWHFATFTKISLALIFSGKSIFAFCYKFFYFENFFCPKILLLPEYFLPFTVMYRPHSSLSIIYNLPAISRVIPH